MKYAVCTSFSHAGYKLYGQTFIETYLKYWPETVPLHVYHEGTSFASLSGKWRRVWTYDLRQDQDCRWFEQAAPAVDVRAGTDHHIWGAVKWSKKVFALHNLSHRLREIDLAPDWLIWIDADVETTQPITEHWLGQILPEDKALAFLARPHYRYSECGFVGYHLADPRVVQLLQKMRETYTSLDVFKLAERGDSYVFDWCRRQQFQEQDYKNLSPQVPDAFDRLHVWPGSALGAHMAHHKGNRRKRKRYGEPAARRSQLM